MFNTKNAGPASIHVPSKHLVLGDIVLDCLEQLVLTNNDTSKTVRDLMSEKLEVRKQEILDSIKHDVGLEMHLVDITINATQHVIDEYNLHEAYTANQLSAYWRKICRDSQEVIKRTRSLSSEDVESITEQCINNLKMTVPEDLRISFARYLRFRCSHENLVQDLFSGKMPESMQNFYPIEARTYVNVALEKKIAALKTAIKEPECSGIAKALTQRLEEENVVAFLTNSTLEEKKKFLENKDQKKIRLDDILVEKVEVIQTRIQNIQDQMDLVPDKKSIDIDIEKVTTQVLANAVEVGSFSLIARVLTFAKKHNLFDSLLREALLANINDAKKLTNLIAGVYLYSPQEDGLFNPKFLDNIFNGNKDANVLTLKKKLESFKKNMGNDDIHVKLLEHADENALAHMIKHAGKNQWPHNAADCGENIRCELARRYVDTGKQISPEVKKNLQINWDVAQRGQQLATVYARAAKHVYENFPEDKNMYRKQINSISSKIAKVAKGVNDLTDEAVNIANNLLTSNDNINLRRSKYFNWFSRSTTQRIVAETKSMLQPGLWGCIKKNIAYAKHTIFGSDLKAAKEILEKPPAKLHDYLTKDDVNVIPITSQEKDKCIERAVWARARFKSTLDHLANRPAELSIMEHHLRLFESGVYKEEHVLAARLRDDLISNAKKSSYWTTIVLDKDLRSRSAAFCP